MLSPLSECSSSDDLARDVVSEEGHAADVDIAYNADAVPPPSCGGRDNFPDARFVNNKHGGNGEGRDLGKGPTGTNLCYKRVRRQRRRLFLTLISTCKRT